MILNKEVVKVSAISHAKGVNGFGATLHLAYIETDNGPRLIKSIGLEPRVARSNELLLCGPRWPVLGSEVSAYCNVSTGSFSALRDTGSTVLVYLSLLCLLALVVWWSLSASAGTSVGFVISVLAAMYCITRVAVALYSYIYVQVVGRKLVQEKLGRA